MPLSRLPRPPDLERVRAVLGAPPPREPKRAHGAGAEGGGWLPDAPDETAPGPPAPEQVAEPELGLREELELLDVQLRRARRPGLLSMPDQLRSGRIHVSSAAVVALLALVVALGCAFLLRILWAERSANEARPTAPAVVSTRGAGGALPSSGPRPSGGATVLSGAAGGPAGGGDGAATAAAGQVVVHVVGQVLRPGLVRLKPGARVADAIEAAGGATTRADLSGVNLARPVTDGEQIVVPRPGDVVAPPAGASGGTGVGGASGSGAGSAGGSSAGAMVNLNSAGLADLDSLPGVGPVLAQRILDWRTEHGRFSSVDELGEVSGIGDKLLAQLRPKVTV